MTEETAQAIERKLAEDMEEKDTEQDVLKPIQVGFKRLTEDAVIPTKAHPTDSGFDLVASTDVIIEPGETAVVPTGIAVQLPAGYEAQVRPRSGVTSKTKLRVAIGTIDNSYRGGIGVIVDNIGLPEEYYGVSYAPYGLDGEIAQVSRDKHTVDGAYLIRKGDRIAQLVITRLPEVEAVEVFDVGESERGDRGFGSSGVSSE